MKIFLTALTFVLLAGASSVDVQGLDASSPALRSAGPVEGAGRPAATAAPPRPVPAPPVADPGSPPSATTPEPAPPPAAQPNPLEPRVQELEETVRQLQESLRQLQQQVQKPPGALDKAQIDAIMEEKRKQAVPSSGTLPPAGWQNGFFLQSADGANRLRLGGYVQSTARAFPSSGGATGVDSFYLQRVRPTLEGTVARHVDFLVQPDFGEGNTALKNAYLVLHFTPQFHFQTGKFQPPPSLELLQPSSNLLFVVRSVSSNLATPEDVGLQLIGTVARGALTYQLGGTNGVNDGNTSDGDTGSSKDLVARLFAQPFKNQARSPLQGLGIGVGLTTGGRDNQSVSNVNYRTAGHSTFFSYNSKVVATGTQSRLAPQLYYYAGPYGLMAEQITSRVDLRNGTTRGTMTNRGWFVQASRVLTGEKASYAQDVVPRKPLDPRTGGWGAVELAVRYSQIDVDSAAFRLGFADPAASASKANALSLGLNWYLNAALKLQLNYERTNFNRAILFGSGVRDHEDVFLSQLQVAF
jgi:phosphate-selective porin OprO/OprP